MAKNPIGRSLGIGHRGKTCQNEPPSENCEAKREAIKMAKNPIGNHKGLGIGHRGKTCQNEPPPEKQSIYEHIYEQRDKQCKEEKTFCESGMTCQQPISHDSYHSAYKIEETTDEQSISDKVRGKPEDEDQHTATECVCCLVCPQLICLCCQTRAQAGAPEMIAKPSDMKNGGRATNQLQDETQEGMEQDILTFLTAKT